MVKLIEMVIRKRRVTQKQKIDINTKKEKVTIRYPDGNTEVLDWRIKKSFKNTYFWIIN